MKDLVIKGDSIRREIKVLIVCVLVAFILNVISIIVYDTQWLELVTTLHYTVLLGIAIYAALGILRLLIWAIKKIFSRRRQVV